MAHSDSIEAMKASAGTGELLTVRYHGGSHPGMKRRIVIMAIDDELLQVRVPPSTQPKSYFISQTEVCGDDYPAPWAPAERLVKWTVVEDPQSIFDGWHFLVIPAHYPALGVDRRWYMDKEKNKAAKAHGENSKHKVLRYARSEPPLLDFHEGDTFSAANGGLFLQVVRLWTSKRDVEMMEAHASTFNGRRAYQLPIFAFVSWLQNGDIPDVAARICKRNSRSEVLWPLIIDPEDEMTHEPPTITVGELREQLSQWKDEDRISFSGLTFYRIKGRGESLAQVEFNQPVYLDERGRVVVQNLE